MFICSEIPRWYWAIKSPAFTDIPAINRERDSFTPLILQPITFHCTDKIAITPNQPCLKIQQLVIDLLDVDVGPEDVVVAVDCLDDTVVQAVQLLQ